MPPTNLSPEQRRTILRQRQSLPLEAKVRMSLKRIREWYEHWDGDVYVSFSGGKDSTVLLDLVRSVYPDVPAVFLDTGLEFPEIRDFVRSTPNVTWIRPKMSFLEVIHKYGYPVVSKDVSQKLYQIRNTRSDILRSKRMVGDAKGNGRMAAKWQSLIDAPFKISHLCCDALKKRPAKLYERQTGAKPYVGTMTGDSTLRATNYQRHGCNNFAGSRPMSAPMSFWTEVDVWQYLREKQVPYCSIYDQGYERTGCMFCAFGAHLEKEPNRFQRMRMSHPKQWAYCMDNLGMREVLATVGVKCE